MRFLNREGQAIVEFCVILPLLLILLVGTIEFGLVMYDKAVITNASREGARAGIVARTPRMSASDIQDVVRAYCTGRLITFGSGTPSIDVNPNPTPSNPTNTDTLTVTVTYNYGFLSLPNFIGSGPTLTLGSRTVMRYE